MPCTAKFALQICVANLLLQYGAVLALACCDPRGRGRLCICISVSVYLCICLFAFVYCKVVAIWCILAALALAGIDPRERGHLCGPRLAPHAQPHSVLTLVTAFLLPFSFATLATVFSQIYIPV